MVEKMVYAVDEAWEERNAEFCRQMELRRRVLAPNICSELQSVVHILMREMYTMLQEEWEGDMEFLKRCYGDDTVAEAINAWHRLDWRPRYNDVVKQIASYTADMERRQEAQRKLEQKARLREAINNAKAVSNAVDARTHKFRCAGICKHSERCEKPGCKFVHPGHRDYKKALYQRIAKVVGQGLETSGPWMCRNGDGCVAHSFGLCLYAHSVEEQAKAVADNAAASANKRVTMAMCLADLWDMIRADNDKSHREKRKPKPSGNGWAAAGGGNWRR